jgi:hypothetical protein
MDREQNIKEIAVQLLAGMLANPHIYATISDEEGKGQQEQMLVMNAIRMAEMFMDKLESSQNSSS